MAGKFMGGTFEEFRHSIDPFELDNLLTRYSDYVTSFEVENGRYPRSKYSGNSVDFLEFLYIVYRRQARRNEFEPESYADAWQAIADTPRNEAHFDPETGTWVGDGDAE